jgi:hypothetical protein
MKFGTKLKGRQRGGNAAGTRRGQGFAVLVSAGSLLWGLGCGGKEKPPEAPSPPTPGGTSEQLGAPRDTRYTADIEATRGRVRVIVREESLCDVIPVQSMIENGKKRYIAGDPTSSRTCNQRVARNVMLSLEVGGNTFRLGEPSPQGEVQANMSDRMLSDLYGDDKNSTPVAKLMLRDQQGKSQEIGTIALAQLAATEQRLDQLLAEFRRVLDRPQEQLTGAELAHAYELYEELARFESSDPRIAGLQALFMERLYARKAVEANERFRNNLDALNSAKNILATMPHTVVVPPYVSGAINGGTLDDRSVDWARGQVAIAIRNYPTLCGPNPETGFTWSRLQLSPPPPESRLAFEVLRFAYDNPYEKEIAQLCRRVLG